MIGKSASSNLIKRPQILAAGTDPDRPQNRPERSSTAETSAGAFGDEHEPEDEQRTTGDKQRKTDSRAQAKRRALPTATSPLNGNQDYGPFEQRSTYLAVR